MEDRGEVMSYQVVMKQIKAESPLPVMVFYGEERFLMNWSLEQLEIAVIGKENLEFNRIRLDGKTCTEAEIVDQCETFSFFAQKKMVIVDDYEALTTKGKGKLARLEAYVSAPASETILIFRYREGKPDGRKACVKTIKKKGGLLEFARIDRKALMGWITKRVQAGKCRITPDAMEALISMTGYLDRNSEWTLYDMENEVNKLLDYGDRKRWITLEEVEAVGIRGLENDVFRMVDAITRNQPKVVFLLVHDLLESGEAVEKILYMIARQFRLLALAKLHLAKGYGPSDLAKRMKVQPFVAKQLVAQATPVTQKALDAHLGQCIDADQAIKTGRDRNLTLEMLLAQLMS
jgi:DNA polymerase-3 subunit delta